MPNPVHKRRLERLNINTIKNKELIPDQTLSENDIVLDTFEENEVLNSDPILEGNGIITEVNIIKKQYTQDQLQEMTKKQLIELCGELNLEVDVTLLKSEIIQTILNS